MASRRRRATKSRAEKLQERKVAQERDARQLEHSDNNGFIIKRMLHRQARELAGMLAGAPKAVKSSLAADCNSGMKAADFRENAWFAAYTDNVDDIIAVSASGYSVDHPHGRLQHSPFHIACAEGQLGVVEFMASTPGLVKDLNAVNRSGASPFFLAVANGHADIVKFLAAKRKGENMVVDIEKPNHNGIVPWELAKANADKPVVEALAFARGVRREEEAAQLHRLMVLSAAASAGKNSTDGSSDEGEDEVH